jgi:hypothetical protein
MQKPMAQTQQKSKCWISPAIGVSTATVLGFGLWRVNKFKKKEQQKKHWPFATITHIEKKEIEKNRSEKMAIKKLRKRSLYTTLLLFDVNSLLLPETNKIDEVNLTHATQNERKQKKENADLVHSIRKSISKLDLPQDHEINNCMHAIETYKKTHKFNYCYSMVSTPCSPNSTLMMVHYKIVCCPEIRPHAEQIEKVAQAMLTEQQLQLKTHFANLRKEAKEQARRQFEFECLG